MYIEKIQLVNHVLI